MNTRERIKEYLDTQPEPKRSDMQELHRIILERMPKYKLWFLDGKDDEGRTVSNPTVGYGLQVIKYADGRVADSPQQQSGSAPSRVPGALPIALFCVALAAIVAGITYRQPVFFGSAVYFTLFAVLFWRISLVRAQLSSLTNR